MWWLTRSHHGLYGHNITKSTSSIFQLLASNIFSDYKNRLGIDNKTLGLPFPLDLRLYEVEKSNQVKPRKRLSNSFRKKT